jgi:hypothetical protein
MKTIKKILYCALFFSIVSCTGDFDEINVRESGFEASELSAKFILTETQFQLYAPSRFAYWRAHLIHADRFAGHFTFGHDRSWWSDGLSYTYDGGYTDATFGWFSDNFSRIKQFLDETKQGANFDNQKIYATGLIIKSLFYQMYTDTFGMVPFSEAGVDGILTPKFDSQKDIYIGVITDLNEAMTLIGSSTRTGDGVDDLGSNDVYCGGDLQKWKKLANTLKLRIAMRALGATGENFATAAINEALTNPLLDNTSGSVIMQKDNRIGQWGSATYGDVWTSFGAGSDWTMGATLINNLQNNNDPRLTVYAAPAPGGEFFFDGSDAVYQERLDFLIANLDNANARYTKTVTGTETKLTIFPNQFIGQPTRLNGLIKPMVKFDMFSKPNDIIKQASSASVLYPEIIMTSAEAYFLQAEAAVRGIGGGNAQSLFESGIKEAMKLWNIPSGDTDAYVMNEAAANITTGTLEQKIEKIATQRWLASYTDGFEAWAVVRDYGYPAELSVGVSNTQIFELGTLNGKYPQRMRYGTGAQSNPNYTQAVSTQGADVQETKLWYAK